jgi:hypothetical protein
MAKNIDIIAKRLHAKVVGKVPDTGGGAFGASRLAAIVTRLRSRLQPSQGERPGRPTDPSWTHHPKIPMTEETRQKLTKLAEQLSDQTRKITPMQLAAQLLEDAVAHLDATTTD